MINNMNKKLMSKIYIKTDYKNKLMKKKYLYKIQNCKFRVNKIHIRMKLKNLEKMKIFK